MAGMSEKITLLGAGLYTDIPDELTLKSIPTATELTMAGSEDFDQTMLDTVLPQCIEEKINPRSLLEIDYQWVLRGLRILSYGPIYTVNRIYCDACRERPEGEFQVNLNTVNINTLPEGFKNEIVISKDEFIQYDKDITIKMLTVQERINSEKDKMFQINGKTNSELARICYMIRDIGGKQADSISSRASIVNNMIDADYRILLSKSYELTNYGLTIGGRCGCPKCHSTNATFMVFVDGRFFRPTLGDLKEWKAILRSERGDKDI